MANKLTLSANVHKIQGNTIKVPVVTNIHIKVGETVVATAILGGDFNEKQAVHEFRRNHGRFTNKGDFNLANLAELC